MSNLFNKAFLRVCYATLFLLIATSIGGAQISGTSTDGTTALGIAAGAPAGSYTLSDFDVVNLYNGNLNLQLPLLGVNGRGGAKYAMTLAVEQRWTMSKWILYSEQGNNVFYVPEPNWWAGIRPGYGPGVLLGRAADYQKYGCQNQGMDYAVSLTRLTFVAPDGTEHELRDQLLGGAPVTRASCTWNPMPSRGTVFTSADGTAMTFVSEEPISDIISGGLVYPSGTLMFRDGTRYLIEEGLVSWIRDRNGNMLTFTYDDNSRVSTIVDSLNRKVSIAYSKDTVTFDEITYTGFGGGALRTIKVHYSSLGQALRQGFSLKTFTQLFPPPPDATPLPAPNTLFDPEVVSSVELPDGRQYQFYYNSHRELARVVLPTGLVNDTTRGAFEYDWAAGPSTLPGTEGIVDAGPFFTEGQISIGIYRRVIERRVYKNGSTLEGRTTFSVNDGINTITTVEHRDPAGFLMAREKHYFYGAPVLSLIVGPAGLELTPVDYPAWKEGREYKTEALDTDAGGTVLRKVDHTWQQRAPVAWWGSGAPDSAPANDPRITVTESTLTDLTPNLVSRREFDYDTYNNPTETREFDFGAAVLVRRTNTTYLTTQNGSDYAGSINIHLRSLPVSQRVYVGASSTVTAETQYEYDNYTADANHAPLVDRASISGLHSQYTPSRHTRGNATAVKRWLNTSGGYLTTHKRYDIAGNVVSITDPRSNTSSFDFVDRFGIPDNEAQNNVQAPTELASLTTYAFATKSTNALNQVGFTQYDYYTGKLVNAEDANGVVTKVRYNDLLDRATEIVAAENVPSLKRRTTFSYDDAARMITTQTDQSVDSVFRSDVLYDGLGRTIEMRTASPEGTIYTKQEHDALGRTKRSYNPYRTLSDETYGYIEPTYDPLGRVTRVETFTGAASSTGAVVTTYTGNETTVRDQANKQQRVVADGLGRLKQVDELNESGTLYATTFYEHDVLDNLVHANQVGQHRYFLYDSLSRLIRVRNPEQSINSNILPVLTEPVTGNSQWCMKYTYDQNSNMETRTDARNIRTEYNYDALNRPIIRTYLNDPQNTPSVTYSYDDPLIGYSKGRLTRVSSNVSSYDLLQFDPHGRVTQSRQSTVVGGLARSYTMSYGYDLAGSMTSETYPGNDGSGSNGRVVKTEYDSAGRIAGIRNGAGASAPYYAGGAPTDINRVAYAPHGAVSMMKLGNGLWEHTNFNSRLQSTQIGLGTTSSGAGSTSVLGLDYTYGVIVGGALDTTKNNGNIESQTINAPGLSLKQNYTYDQVNRLLSASEALSGAQQWKQQFTYDRFGNRNFDLASTTGNVLGPNPTIDPSTNRFASGQSYEYDLSGNITKDPTTNPNVILYDAENRQVSYTKAGATTAYVYDGGGYRVQRITGGEATVFVYDVAGKLIAEYDTDPPPNPVGGGGTSYLTTDHLGSTRVVTTGGPSPTLKARYDYLPFGEEIAPTLGNRTSVTGYLPSDSTRQKFTQYERDTESGLDFAGARYCSSGVGRFTSVDPSLASARSLSPQSWNRYVYVLNNPLVYIDPDGADWYRHNETGVFHWFPGSDPRDGYTWYKVGEAGLRLTNVRGYGRFAKYNGHNIVLLPNGQVIDQGLYVPPPPTDLPNLSGQVGIILAQMEPHHLIIVIAIVVTADVMYPLPNRNDAIPEFNDPLPSSNDALPGAPTPPVDWIVPGSLPAEEDAALLFALEHLDNGTRPPGVQSWGRPFRNDRGDLPGPAGGGGYSEYDVTPPPGTLNRGVRRIVASDTDGRVYYTWTHYGTAGDPPFVRVR